jgi:tellurite resistance protein TerC
VDVPFYAWVAVLGVIAAALAVDLLLLHRHAHEISIREAALSSAAWIAIGLTFGVVVWLVWGGSHAAEYFSGYLIEKSLSIDNIFIFALLLGYFRVPARYQHRVLFWGVVGALILRGLFIAAGVPLLERFHWVIYGLGALLIISGIRMLTHRQAEVHPDKNPMLRLLRRVVPVTDDYEGQRFFLRRNGRLLATPMLAVLVAVETTDIVFAVDSIPAIFAVTKEPFLIFTSNAFAILGLRAVYFLLLGVMDRFAYLKLALSALLAFVGAKMLLTDVVHVPVWASLLVIIAILSTAVIASLRSSAKKVSSQVDRGPHPG